MASDASYRDLLQIYKTNGGEEFIQMLLRNGENVNREYEDGQTLLHLFANLGSYKLVQYLWDHGAKPTLLGIDKSNVLLSAVRAKDSSEDEERAQILELFLKGQRDKECEEQSEEIDVNHRNERGWTAVKLAARKNLERCVEVLVQYNADPDIADNEDYTPLHNSIDNPSILKLLAVKCENLNRRNQAGETALYMVCDRGSGAGAYILLEQGADPNISDRSGVTPLFLASRNGNVDLVKALVKAGANVNHLGGTQNLGPLHWAAHKEYTEVALFLIEHKGDILLEDKEGRTPLSMASPALAEKMIEMTKRNNPDFAVNFQPGISAKEKALAACCGGNLQALDSLLKNKEILINMVSGKTKGSLLHMAAYCGQMNIAAYLVHEGADCLARDTENDTILHFACMKVVPHGSHLSTVEFLLVTSAIKSINSRNSTGDTPLMVAVRCGFAERAKAILKAGADPLIGNNKNELPLHRACGNDTLLELVMRLAEVTPDINVQDKDGWSPLMFACKSKCKLTVQYLLQRGANPSAKQGSGFSALYLAAQENAPEICALLLESGADPNEQGGPQKLSALHFAAHSNHMAVCCVLVEHGANPQLEDADGDTPISLASPELHTALLIAQTKYLNTLRQRQRNSTAQNDPRLRPPNELEDSPYSELSNDSSREAQNKETATGVDKTESALVESQTAIVGSDNLVKEIEELKFRVKMLEEERQSLLSEMHSSHLATSHPTEPVASGLDQLQIEFTLRDYQTLKREKLVFSSSFKDVHLGCYHEMNVTVVDVKCSESFNSGLTAILKLKSPNLVSCLGICTDEPVIHLVCEPMHYGTLNYFLKNRDFPLEYSKQLSMALDVACGLAYLHRQTVPILYQYLHTTNVLVNRHFVAKLSLEGLLQQSVKKGSSEFSNFYCPPEIIEGTSSFCKSSDVYMFGLFLYELVTRREICFDEEGRHLDELRFTYKIIMGGRPLIEDTLPQECNSLICGCWSQDPIERFEIKQVVSKLKEITEEDFNCN